MNIPEQNTIIRSLDRALVPGSILVDGRTERDRLSFIADFASLINFYDHTNTMRGNWRPFILKDPVFLLAHISATNDRKWQTLFKNEIARLDRLQQVNAPSNEIGIVINHLFDQLTSICLHIERWTFYMQQSFDYDLKRFVLREVNNNFSEFFWALMALRDAVYKSAPDKGVYQVAYFLFDSFDEVLWKQSRGRRPYWEVLQIEEDLISVTKTPEQNLNVCCKVMDYAGKVVFRFLHTIVEHAPKEYERVKAYSSRHPDTTLLRTFEKLLRIYQDDQNKLSAKHLRFYYQDILKQKKRQALADQVYLCAIPAGNNAVFNLPAGLLLDSGLDAQNNPVNFATTENISVNPATIANAYTISTLRLTKTLSSVFLQSIPSPGVIKKDEQGNITGWKTFGGSSATGSVEVNTGIIIASPILLLQEGDRVITCNMIFEENVSMEFLSMGSYYLSTQDAWINITQVAAFKQVSPKQVKLLITLPASQLPVMAYPANPEGAVSAWPMLKMEFSYFSDPTDPPVLTELTIEVKASKLKNFQLYNESGGLSAKAPFPLFGNIPGVNASFIIGSSEVFSKPLQTFYMEFAWDKNLPDNFQNYYQAYNDYIYQIDHPKNQPDQPQSEENSKAGVLNTLVKIGSVIISPLKKIIGLFKSSDKKENATTPPDAPVNFPFNNVCFTVNFSMMDTHAWNPVNLTGMNKLISPEGNVSFIPYQRDAGCVPPADSDTLLFGTQSSDTVNCILSSGSYFGLAQGAPSAAISPFPGTPDPDIQLIPLQYSEKSNTGFIKMTLTGPDYGFGSVVYPNVVADTALRNALIISAKPTDPPTQLVPPANSPFIPKVAEFQAHYSASASFVFKASQEDYPVQVFSFSPVSSGWLYDNASATSANVGTGIYAMPGAKEILGGIPLHPAFPYQGSVFLELDNLIAPAELSVYFQLAKNYGNLPKGNNCYFSYLTNGGWNNLPLLADGTNQFGCSGLIKLSVPSDISNIHPFMGRTKYWISIGVTADSSLFSDTVFLQTNGLRAVRTGSSFLTAVTAPVLASGVITKAVTAVPQVAAFNQPFDSFGGRAAEDEYRMNQRVSNRIKTKDRAVTAEDYYRLIRLNFPDIYYVKTIFDNDTKSTNVYVARAFENINACDVYKPLITECSEGDIQSFLQQRASVFAAVTVSNFDLQFVDVQADIEIKPGFAAEGVIRKINEGLNLFLSPWIKTAQQQIIIDRGITDAQVAAFISGIDGVAGVCDISFESWTIDGNSKQMVSGSEGSTIMPVNEKTLFVSAMNHNLKVMENTTVTA